MRWGDTVTLEFVKLYMKHECLWNPEHPSYKNKLDRNKAYYKIFTEFEALSGKALTIPEIKVKIKNLRSTYAQQVHKIMHESGPDGMYQPTLIWFNEMDRCLKNIPLFVRQSIVTKYRDDAPNMGGDFAKPDSEIQTEESEEHHSDAIALEKYTFGSAIKKRNTYKRSKKRKRRTSPYFSVNSNDEDIYVDNRSVEDEFDIYGKFIAAQLRRMDLQKALKVQLQIQRLVSEARISD